MKVSCMDVLATSALAVAGFPATVFVGDARSAGTEGPAGRDAGSDVTQNRAGSRWNLGARAGRFCGPRRVVAALPVRRVRRSLPQASVAGERDGGARHGVSCLLGCAPAASTGQRFT